MLVAKAALNVTHNYALSNFVRFLEQSSESISNDLRIA